MTQWFKIKKAPKVLDIQRIWDRAPHNALTDLILFQKQWYCVFRESDKHVRGENGTLRLITSVEGKTWETKACFAEGGIDLRDPKLSITPDGRLILLAGGTKYGTRGQYLSRQPRVAFSQDGKNWGRLVPILSPHEWLWRVTWHKGKGYGVSYTFSDPAHPRRKWLLKLFVTNDGIHYKKVGNLDVPGYPNETTLRFQKNGKVMALVRRDNISGSNPKNDNAWIGTSMPPYTNWKWKATDTYIGGPNFLILPNGTMVAAGRTKTASASKLALFALAEESLTPVLELPSGGDCSYPGMVLHKNVLWMSYYSSHESNTAIYLAKFKMQ